MAVALIGTDAFCKLYAKHNESRWHGDAPDGIGSMGVSVQPLADHSATITH
jgi:hypothetical protein